MTDTKTPSPETHLVARKGTCLAGEQRGTDDRLNRSHIGNDHDSLAALVGNIDGHREGVAGLKQDPSQFLLQTLDGFCTDLLNTCTLGSDIVNALPAVEIVEEVEGQDQAPFSERADQSLVKPRGANTHELANIATPPTDQKSSNLVGQKRTVPAPQTNLRVNDDLRKRVMRAIFDPGVTEGFKGDRDLTTWQTDAVMRALATTEGSDNG